jgi:hypothetical protein
MRGLENPSGLNHAILQQGNHHREMGTAGYEIASPVQRIDQPHTPLVQTVKEIWVR